MKKRILSLLLCLMLCFSLMPMNAFAAEPTIDDLKFTLNPDTDIVFLTNEIY